MKEYSTILVERKPPMGKITYNQPDKRNAMTIEMIDEATEAFLDFEKDDKVRVIVITHTGTVFSAGMPQSYILGKDYDTILDMSKRFRAYHSLVEKDITKPVIAVTDGVGSFDEADIILASTRATYSSPAINIGLF
jgi:enoyl-CoA hydratase/carnithine racemase